MAESVDVVMPQMGVSVSEGTITKWLKREGEQVAADEPLLEISTDKVDTEVPSPGSGVLSQILVPEGETVSVGTRLATIGDAAAGEAQAAEERAPAGAAADGTGTPQVATQAAADAAMASASEGVGGMTAGPETPTEVPAAPPTEPSGDGRTFVSPVVARIAAEHGVDLGQVPGSGRGGRVTKKDIMAFIDAGAPTEVTERAAPPPAPERPVAATPTVPETPATPREPAPPAPPRPAPEPVAEAGEPRPGESFEPMSAMRRGISEHMRRSLDTSAHVTTVFEIDMSNVVASREKLRKEYEASYGVRLTYLPFIARAVVDAIRNWPWVNGELRGDTIVAKQFVNLGIAVALDGGKGLIVPVIKNAEALNLLGLARAINDLGDRARTKKLVPDDVQGGTFTITNPGGFGAIMGTPIINQPQVAILDVEALVKRPVVVADEHGTDVIAIRPMMNLCLSYDHRLVDGAYAAQFMRELKQNLEGWDESAA